ncbi:uncharacterized protein MELLADRAFT_95442 [Melampsora larici-populina 98AG31]|uniref:CxC5 like cysteine cluster associated with KDZ domain-containing protein n=1 Tax=Melampsora larici-populina (strain 98AG31 / pathotype 3-4-7) TaxID=747676 RepID=F4S9C0_MELLP|nr:uncharacterized protein MELLADRAFT_95442 [Melampsora larici-populina 98AG31]EGF98698.1 hypothetical protein MELLADRAFT_95442 [Melampsora larici-populina 98AG31]
MLLRDFVDLMTRDSPRLSATLSVADFVRFVSLAGEVQHRAGQSVRLTPNRNTLLPFLKLALSPHYPHDLLPDLWRLSFPLLDASRINTSAAIRDFGLHPELLGTKMPERFLRAPMSHCTLCSRDHSFALHVHSCLDGYLYDIDGVHAIQTVILCCSNKACGTFYRPSYYTRDDLRIYYSQEMARNTTFLHIHCHYYMTTRMSYMLRVLQMLAHVSHFNLVNWYDQIFVDDTPVHKFIQDQSFTPSMSEEVCRDGLILHSLMNHADRRGVQLAVNSSGNDNIIDAAIKEHLELLSVEGTKFRDHYCSSCVRLASVVDPKTGEEYCKSIRAVVTDGLTIGHWRCSASTQQLQEIATQLGLPAPEGPCTNKLDNINDRFCPYHYGLLGGRCRAQPCSKAAVGDTETCGDAQHIKVWADFNKKTQANFSLTALLNRPGSNLPPDPTVHLDTKTGQFADLESIQQADESQRAHESARDGGQSQAAGK